METVSSKERSYKTKPCRVHDLEFPSMKAAAAHYGIKPNSVSCRLRDGWTLAQALGAEQRTKTKAQGIDVTVNGVIYPSIMAACKALKLSNKVVHSRMKAGYTINQAFGLEEVHYKSKPKVIMVDGRQFKSLADACRFYSIDKYVLNARVNRYGWSIEQALEVTPRPGYEKGVIGMAYLVTNLTTDKKYVGVTMGTVEERWVQHVNKALSSRRLNDQSLHTAIARNGPGAFKIEIIAKAESLGELGDLETAMIKHHNSLSPIGFNLNRGGSGSRTKGIAIQVAGQRFASLKAACKYFGLEWNRVRGRLNMGWEPEEVFGLVQRTSLVGPKPVTVSGIEYRSISKAAEAFGLAPALVSSRLRSGWTIEQAVGPIKIKPGIVFQGKNYESVALLCKELKVRQSTFSNRYNKLGWTMGQALGIEPSPMK
ncbi:GIY-YIG nuclease family protein [Pseudomonas guineae]|uniref:GIY-YIG nuclease family protein n=1 Tax=Pseudomonas guineae TaxID=425504 RepID=UPI003D06A3A5